MVAVIDRYWEDDDKDLLVFLGVGAIGASLILTWQMWVAGGEILLINMSVSRLSLVMIMVVQVFILLNLLMLPRYYQERGKSAVRYVVFYLFVATGAFFALATSHLLIILGGWMVLFLSKIFLVRLDVSFDGQRIRHLWTREFSVLVIFSLGAVFYFGATGTFWIVNGGELLPQINTLFTGNYFRIAITLMSLAFFIPILVQPFHSVAAGESGETQLPVGSLLLVGFPMIFLFLFLNLVLPLASIWSGFLGGLVFILAIVSMTFSNLMLYKTDQLRSFIGYSIVAYTGYALVLYPILGVPETGAFYAIVTIVMAAAFMHVGFFGVLQFLSKGGAGPVMMRDLDGLGKQSPWVAATATLFLLALAGVPPLVGFFARYLLLRGIFSGSHVGILVLVSINMVLAAFNYFRPIARIYLHSAASDRRQREWGTALVVAIVVAAVFTVLLGLFPTSFIEWISVSLSM